MKNFLFLAFFLLCSCTANAEMNGIIRVYDNTVYQNVKPMLLADFTKHGIITEELPSFSPIQLFSKEWGHVTAEELYNKLTLSFRYPSSEDSRHWTFANLAEEYTDAVMYSHGFTAQHGLEQVTVSLLGDMKWDRNDTLDWLVYCRFEEKQSKDKVNKNNIRLAREYLLMITDRTGSYWQAQPIVIRDLKLYSIGYDSTIYRNLTPQKQKALEPSLATDFEAGYAPILEKPEAPKNGRTQKNSSGQNRTFTENSLSEQSLSE